MLPVQVCGWCSGNNGETSLSLVCHFLRGTPWYSYVSLFITLVGPLLWWWDYWWGRYRSCCRCCCRYEAYGWHTQVVADGTNTSAIMEAVEKAKQETGKPSIIKTKTIIGHGSTKQVSYVVSPRTRSLSPLNPVLENLKHEVVALFKSPPFQLFHDCCCCCGCCVLDDATGRVTNHCRASSRHTEPPLARTTSPT